MRPSDRLDRGMRRISRQLRSLDAWNRKPRRWAFYDARECFESETLRYVQDFEVLAIGTALN